MNTAITFTLDSLSPVRNERQPLQVTLGFSLTQIHGEDSMVLTEQFEQRGDALVVESLHAMEGEHVDGVHEHARPSAVSQLAKDTGNVRTCSQDNQQ
eukprot:scaffold7464_cov136-Isochrysis_galbana.AAC.1